MRSFAMVAALFLAAAGPAVAQNGVVYGTAYDVSGNPLAGARIILENTALGFSRSTTTSTTGSYHFGEVPPAPGYTIALLRDDNRLDTRTVTVNVGEERRVIPPLTERPPSGVVGEKTDPETALRIDRTGTAMSGVITGEQLRSLPLYNRNFLALGLLAPGTHEAEPGSALTGASFSISGMRPSSNNFLIDGADNVASSTNQAVPFQVNDAIQEFRVISANAPAEYGRNMGGVVDVVTSRGSNVFHGSAYGFLANDALNADNPLSVYNGTTFDKAAAYAGDPGAVPVNTQLPADYKSYVTVARNNGYCTDSFASFQATPSACVANVGGRNTFFNPAAILRTHDRFKQPFDSKQFGANAGGAVRKDKLFVFGSYEGTRIDNPNPIFERVPSDFDKRYNPLGAPLTFASTPARSLFSATSPDFVLAQDVLALFPDANVVGVPGVLEFYRGEAPNYTNVHNVLLRADWAKSARTVISTRYVAQILDQLHDASLPAPSASNGYPGNGALRHAFNQNLSGSIVQTFSSSIINELRAGFNRFNVRETAQDSGFDARTLGVVNSNFPDAALPTILLNGLDTQYSGAHLGQNGAFVNWAEFFSVTPSRFMQPSLDGFFPYARIGAPLYAPNSRADTTVFVSDKLSVAIGRHSVKSGIEVRRLNNVVHNGAYHRGFVYSSNIGEFAHDSESCNQLCAVPDAFLRPSFDFARKDGVPLEGDFRSWALAIFLQDSWRVGTRVTVNAGVRYEFFSPPEERDGRTWNFDPIAGGLIPRAGNPVTVDPFGDTCDPTAFRRFRSTPEGVPFFLGPWTSCSATGQANPELAALKVAPRFGVAWDVFGTGKTVGRLGAGIFWDQLPAANASHLALNRPVTGNNVVYGQLVQAPVCLSSQCGLGNSMINPGARAAATLDGVNPNTLWTEAAFPFAVYARDANHTRTPRAVQLNLSIQQQISSKFVTEVGYSGTLGRDLPVIFNSNFGTQFSASFATGAGAFKGFPVFTQTNQGESNYHSLVARAQVAEWHGLRLNAAYVFSRSLDNASSSSYSTAPAVLGNVLLQKLTSTSNPAFFCFIGFCATGIGSFPGAVDSIDFGGAAAVTTTGLGKTLVTPYSVAQDPFNFLSDDYGRSDFDATHRVVVDYDWKIPSGSHQSRWLTDWQVSGVFFAQSGQPFTIFASLASPIELTQRANLIGVGPRFDMNNPEFAISASGLALAFTTCQFQVDPTTACTGNSPRNGFTGPRMVNFDLAVTKGFALAGRERALSLRAEVYNLWNQRNFHNPITVLNSSLDRISPEFGKIKSAHAPRRLQFAARFNW